MDTANTTTQGGKGDAYLKIMITMINEGQGKKEIDLQLGRPLRLEDLTILSSENLLKILVYLLGEIIGEKPISNVVKMTDFNNFEIGELTYDCGPDHIYHAVKQLFGEGWDFFHYSILLFPGRDPVQTKLMLSYIMSFVCMCDDVHEDFSQCYGEMQKEDKEKAAICSEILDLKEQISDAIQESDRNKQRLPILQRELQTVEEHIRMGQVVLSNLNKSLDLAQTNYEAKEREIKKMEEVVEQLETKREELSLQLVPNPDEIKIENARVKKELDSNAKQRESLGVDLGKLQKVCGMFEALILKAKETSQAFEVLVATMQNAKAKMESHTKSGNNISELARQIQHLKSEVDQLALRHSEKTREADTRVKQQQSKHKKLKKEIKQLKRHIDAVRDQMGKAGSEMDNIRESITDMAEQVKLLQVEQTNYIHDVLVTVPTQREVADREQLAEMCNIYRKFGKITGAMLQEDDY